MRFEIPKPGSETLSDLRLHENPNTKVNFNLAPTTGDKTNNIGNCGSKAGGMVFILNSIRTKTELFTQQTVCVLKFQNQDQVI